MRALVLAAAAAFGLAGQAQSATVLPPEATIPGNWHQIDAWVTSYRLPDQDKTLYFYGADLFQDANYLVEVTYESFRQYIEGPEEQWQTYLIGLTGSEFNLIPAGSYLGVVQTTVPLAQYFFELPGDYVAADNTTARVFVDAAQIPLPASAILLLAGVGGLVVMRRRS